MSVAEKLARIAGVALGFLFLANPARALNLPWRDCEAPTVSIRFQMDPAPVQHRLSVAQLSEQGRAQTVQNGAALDVTADTLGLYRSRIRVSAASTTRVFSGLGRPRICVLHTDLTVELNHAIDLAVELPTGSCQYQSALAHEREHERIQTAAIRSSQPMIEDMSQKSLHEFKADNVAEAELALNRAQDKLLVVFSKAMTAKAQRGHLALDTKQEYERVAHSCPAG